MLVPIILVVACTVVAIGCQILGLMDQAKIERGHLEDLASEGRAIGWNEILSRLANGTLLFEDDRYGTAPKGLFLWWTDRKVSPEEERSLKVSDVYSDTSWMVVLGAPRWARSVRLLKRRCPQCIVYGHRIFNKISPE